MATNGRLLGNHQSSDMRNAVSARTVKENIQ